MREATYIRSLIDDCQACLDVNKLELVRKRLFRMSQHWIDRHGGMFRTSYYCELAVGYAAFAIRERLRGFVKSAMDAESESDRYLSHVEDERGR